ncbi:16S rRNA (cytosine(1402)-N(4))-methyltransferase RsmH [Chelatococcus sp. SYSU_G07232]|uniref:Ribosomal RNA small subunit methyltransferase H n=1 Tax=Chelatococcus albus TaxID=3047466 RepID=A0ABT7AIJ8_9HYPH|nr:16S rRNA (cytosine(1402)-N(4))-methyltransferase RsmH [Chelatococcus sp. SYSU_G07232]MDJ1158619.1 16S rRNA (cytosine(1402)-N(4))-methyltransferase RsmH [Chelatococcus sp. SYSU_G07232]
MTGRGDGSAGAAGGPARHVPVLLREVLASLAPKPRGLYLDGTFGAGGYSRAILDAAPGVRLLALDRDPSAVSGGADLVAASAGRLVLTEARFGDLDAVAQAHGFVPLDGVVLDIGVSSMQLDEAGRGFSFRFEGPLDMRMEQAGPSAADLVNHAGERELADIIYHYGEERRSRAVAHAIVEARRRGRISTTKQLADIVATVVRAEPNAPHPATRTFQALRIAVNDELGELVRALAAAERVLAPGGRLVVVTFHSLEDRIVKQFLARRSGRVGTGSRHLPGAPAEAPTFTLVTKGAVSPSEDELAANVRARSAKLRAAERTEAAARGLDDSVRALAELPQPKGRGR